MWGNQYAPRKIIDLIFSFKYAIILFIDLSKLEIINKPVLKIGLEQDRILLEQVINEIIDLT